MESILSVSGTKGHNVFVTSAATSSMQMIADQLNIINGEECECNIPYYSNCDHLRCGQHQMQCIPCQQRNIVEGWAWNRPPLRYKLNLGGLGFCKQ
jgi:hypothetical protein